MPHDDRAFCFAENVDKDIGELFTFEEMFSKEFQPNEFTAEWLGGESIQSPSWSLSGLPLFFLSVSLIEPLFVFYRQQPVCVPVPGDGGDDIRL